MLSGKELQGLPHQLCYSANHSCSDHQNYKDYLSPGSPTSHHHLLVEKSSSMANQLPEKTFSLQHQCTINKHQKHFSIVHDFAK